MRLTIRNGRVIDPESGYDAVADVHVAEGRIAAIGAPPAGYAADRTINAAGMVVAPGLVDLSARLREPGFEYMATLESEVAAAAAGGVTSLACPPDTDPPLDEPGLVAMLKHRARTLNQSRVFPVGALTVGLQGTTLTEMCELTEAGCVAFFHADHPITDTNVLMCALRYASTFGYTTWLRPQDHYLTRGGVAHDGQVATRLGLPGIPSCAETIALSTILQLARETGARIHLARLSTAAAVDMMRAAKREGVGVTCDVAVHHVHLCEIDIGFFDGQCHVIPPFRSVRDRDALRSGLLDGTIDAICSDHTPVDDDAKQLPFGESEAGTTGLELLLPLTLKWAEEAGLSLPAALARITTGPAAVLGLGAGRLTPGVAADLCIFDPQRYWRVDRASLRSMGKNTPFLGYELRGRVCYTVVDGQVIHEE
jgi:dihydroorotase